MAERFVFTKYRTSCYNCGKEVDQVIKAVRAQAQVACSNCGATRIYIPRASEVGKPGLYTKIGCYDVWDLETVAPCENCCTEGPHDLVIGCSQFTTRCHNCGFTHFFKFNVEYIAKCPLPEGEAEKS
ncbi:MAG TPA: hypothetical protein VLV30_04080 [Methanomicrobiales archaeon]|nr:hypothetical protein [Methanomicrobiales archaeon]